MKYLIVILFVLTGCAKRYPEAEPVAIAGVAPEPAKNPGCGDKKKKMVKMTSEQIMTCYPGIEFYKLFEASQRM